MAEQSQTAIFRLNIDEGQAEKRIAELTADLKAARLASQELEKQFNINQKALQSWGKDLAQGKITQQQYNEGTKDASQFMAEYGAASASNQRQIKSLNAERNAEIKVLEKWRQQQQAAKGSVDAMRAELALLTAEYNALSEEERENTEVGQSLQRQTKELSDKLKGQEEAIGDSRRSVGDYTNSILKAVDGSGTLTESIDRLKEIYEGLKDTVELAKTALFAEAEAKAAATAATTASTGAEAANTTATNANTSAQNINRASLIGNVSALKLFRVALLSTGIGAVLVLLGGLISFLTSTQKGMNLVNQATAALSAGFRYVTQSLAGVGEKMVEAFSNPKQAIIDLGKLVLDNLINRVKAFGVIFEAIKKGDISALSNGFFQLGTGVENVSGKTAKLAANIKAAAAAGVDLAKQQQQLDRDNINNIATNKQLLGLIEQQKNVRDNENLSIQERQRANERAAALEQRRLNTLRTLAERQVEILKAEAKERGGINRLTNEQLQKLREAENEVADIIEDSAGRQNETITNRYQLEQEAIEKNREAIQKRLNEEKAAIEAQLLLAKEGSKEQLKLREDLVRKEAQLANTEEGVGRRQRYLNELNANKEILNLNTEYNNRLLEDDKAGIQRRINASRELTDERLQAELDYINKERDIALSNTKLTENQRQLIIEDAQRKEIRTRVEHAQSVLDVERNRIEAFKALQDKEYADTQGYTNQYYDQKNLDLITQLEKGLITQELYDQKAAQLNQEYLQRQIQDAKDYNKSTTELELQASQSRIQIKRDEVSAKQLLNQQEYEFISAGISAVSSLTSIVAGQSKSAAEFQQKLAAFQLVIDSARAISQIITLATAPTAENIATGGLAVPLKIAGLTTVVLANIAKAREMLTAELPDVPEFGRGGSFTMGEVLTGPKHSNGGLDVINPLTGRKVAELEGEEPVLTAGVKRNPVLFQMASMINMLGGGVPLAPTSYAATGGLPGIQLPQNKQIDLATALKPSIMYPSSIQDAKVLEAAFTRALQSMPAPITRVTDINSVQAAQRRITQITDH